MSKILEIIRLSEKGFSLSQIAQSCNVSRTTARDYMRRANSENISSEKLNGLSKEEVKQLFEKKQGGRSNKEIKLDCKMLSRELNKKGVTLFVLWEEHQKEHNKKGLSYSGFCHRYRQYKKSQGINLRQSYKGGEKLFVDYSGLKQMINPKDREEFEASIFVGVLGASNLIYMEATESERMENWISSHIKMFNYFGGVPEIIIPDNLKTGVTSPCRYEPGVNKTYQELAQYYNIAVIPTRIKKPKDKAKVESAVKIVQNRILAKLRNEIFHSVNEFNNRVKPLLEMLNNSKMQIYGCSRWELFNESERSHLKPLPKKDFILSDWKYKKVNVDYHIEVKGCYYSVPFEYVHKELEIKITLTRIEIFDGNKHVAGHRRLSIKGEKSTIKEHMPTQHRYILDRSPSKFIEWARKVGPNTENQINSLLHSEKHIEQNYNSCCGLQNLEKRYGSERLELACRKANELNICSYKSIESMLRKGELKSIEEVVVKREPHSNIRGGAYFH